MNDSIEERPYQTSFSDELLELANTVLQKTAGSPVEDIDAWATRLSREVTDADD